MSEPTYPLSPGGVFRTVQGEGVLAGLPMIFVRLAGCQLACPECDTDYRVAERAGPLAVAGRASALLYGGVEWAWITGGEPTAHDLDPLVDSLHKLGLYVALATAGTRPVKVGSSGGGVDFLSVSPHTLDETWAQRRGDQINVVPGLGRMKMAELGPAAAEMEAGFPHRFVTPLADKEGRPTNLRECEDWVQSRRGWRLGFQAHKLWGLP